MYEPASPNIIAIASLNSSLKWLGDETIEKVFSHKKSLTDYLIDKLRLIGCNVYAPRDLSQHTSVVSFNVNGYLPKEIGDILNLDFDIAVRTGFHCAPYIHSCLGTIETQGTVRASVSYFNNRSDIDSLIQALKEL